MLTSNGIFLVCEKGSDLADVLEKEFHYRGFSTLKLSQVDKVIDNLSADIDIVMLDIDDAGEPVAPLLRQLDEIQCSASVILVGQEAALREIKISGLAKYEYIKKPFNLEEVLRSIDRSLEKRSLKLEIEHYKQQLAKQTENVHQKFLGAMSVMSFALEAKDRYTAGHSRRVADISLAIGKRLGLSAEELDDLCWGSLLHDLAKIAVDGLIINKKGGLTPQEYEHIMTHPVVGACMAQSLVSRKRIIEIIQYHHARYDGKGFKQKLAGEEIPLLARVVSLADAYDAMTSTRPYRAAIPRDEAISIVRNEVGRQFDPHIVQIFLQIPEAELLPARKKILVADDDEGIRVLVRSILGNSYCVIEAPDGGQAVEAVRLHKPALILLDILMPVKDGYQACYEIKSAKDTKNIPVIMLTAVDGNLDRKLASDLGASAYITKPFSPQELVETVRQFCPEEQTVATM